MSKLKKFWAQIISARHKRVLYTIWFNFKHFPYAQAKKLPIVFYNNAYATISNGGRIVLTDEFQKNNRKVYIGVPTLDFEYQCEKTHLNILGGTLKFYGRFEARRGTLMDIRGVANIGDGVRFAPRCRIRIHNQITIGSHVWVCNRCTICPGVEIPDYTVVASNSLVNKNFSHLRPNSLIGGVPAKLLKEGIARVWDYSREFEYHKREFEWYRKIYENK